MKDLNQALNYSNQGIELCIDNETLYLLPELFFQKGRTYEKLGNYIHAIYNMETAKYIFSLMKHTKYNTAIDKIIADIQLNLLKNQGK